MPGSHALRERPSDVLADAFAAHPDEVLVEGVAGDVVVYNAHLWHAETPNESSERRTAVYALYTRRDMPQQQHQRTLLADTVYDTNAGECADPGEGAQAGEGCVGSGATGAGSDAAEVELRWLLDIEAEL